MSEEIVQKPLVLCVGEMNPYGADPYFALYYLPRTASGNNLRRILGLSDEAYMTYCARTNLCRGRWDLSKAREEAARLTLADPVPVFLLLGVRVRDAFNGPAAFGVSSVCGKTLVGLPHPSRRCRVWYDEAQIVRARGLLRAHAPGVPWGTFSSEIAT